MEDKSLSDSQTVRKELTLLSQVSIHFDKEEVKYLYFNLNCNYLKVNELLSNIPSDLIKERIEALEAKVISRDQFQTSMNKLLVEKFVEDERLKKKAKIDINIAEWKIGRSSSEALKRLALFDLIHVCQFLDVFSLYNLSLTERYMYKVEKNPAVYKALCSIVFKPIPQVDAYIYETLSKEVRKPGWGNQSEIKRATILSDIRGFVWGKDPKTIKTSKKYFKDFTDYRQIFFTFPRLRFDGFYSCCETYFRKGEADMSGFYVPIHYVKSYRYLRFFDDGYVLYHISTKKLGAEAALKKLTMDSLHEKNQRDDRLITLTLGEFIVANNSIYIKMPDRSWSNEMEHVMKVDEDGSTYLQILEHKMKDLESGYSHQMEKDMADKERRYYFERVPVFLCDVRCDHQRAVYDFARRDDTE
jgi:hypothetical protein